MAPVRLALLGAGIFAQDAYVPVLQELRDQLLPRFVWSRSQEASEKLVARVREWAEDVEAVWGEEGLCRIEQARDVPCCAVVLPIQAQVRHAPPSPAMLLRCFFPTLRAQAAMVKRLLAAGKHVLQEKPIAASEEEAAEMLRAYASLPLAPACPRKPFWGVAENFRLEPAFAKAAEAVRALGALHTASVCVEFAMAPTNKYYACQWRRDPSLEGAFIFDCGVHYVAALRQMVQRRITSVSAHCSHMCAGLPAPDNLTATFLLEGGAGGRDACSGTLQVTFCAPVNKVVDQKAGCPSDDHEMSWRAVCAEGVVEVARGSHEGKFGYTVTVLKPRCTPDLTFCEFGGIDSELRVFARHVEEAGGEAPVAGQDDAQQAEGEKLLSPTEAMDDLAVVAACLKSGASNGNPIEVDRSFMSVLSG